MNAMMFGIGMSVGFPTIAIPALRGLQPDRYPNETIRLTAEESSWFGMWMGGKKYLKVLKRDSNL